MPIQEGFHKRSRKKPGHGAKGAMNFAFNEEQSDKKSGKEGKSGKGGTGSVGFAFSKGSVTDGGKWAGSGKFGDLDFMKRLLGRAGTNLKNGSGQTELVLMAQLGDYDAIQLLINGGLEGKDALGTSSLAQLAMGGDLDAVRLLGGRGISLGKAVSAEDIAGGIKVVYADAAPVAPAAPVDNSPLKSALAAATQRIENMSRALQGKPAAAPPQSYVPKATT